jgi:hypothetical protein
MTGTINKKIAAIAAVAAACAIDSVFVVFDTLSADQPSGLLYELLLDFFENFLRLPERKIV